MSQTDLSDPPKKPLSRLRGPLGALAVVVVVFGGARLAIDHAADEPIEEGYAKYVNAVAASSPSANAYLERYYARYKRRTVASRHFESVCAEVTTAADRDRFDPERVSQLMARTCRTLTGGRTTGEVPDL
jgi:uncharacterized protein YifE (UPF0438 family)